MTDEDKELLQLAAKAAGLEISRWNQMYATYETSDGMFNPLLNDGDAFLLMCKLKIDVLFGKDDVEASYSTHNGFFNEVFLEFCTDDQSKIIAARRSVVMAAAEMGRQRNGKKDCFTRS